MTRKARVPDSDISKLGYYYITLFVFPYIIRILSLLEHYYITYFFANVRTIISHYCIIPELTIISLMTVLLYHLLFYKYIIAIMAIITLLFVLFLPQTIIAIIGIDDHYITYDFFTAIMLIIAVITLLFALLLFQTIIAIISFIFYYTHYLFSKILYSLLQL